MRKTLMNERVLYEWGLRHYGEDLKFRRVASEKKESKPLFRFFRKKKRNPELEKMIEAAKSARPLTKEDFEQIEKETAKFKEFIEDAVRLDPEDLKVVYGPVKGGHHV